LFFAIAVEILATAKVAKIPAAIIHPAYGILDALSAIPKAALIFAKVYERCGSGSYNLRKQAAVKAYNYFCS
jgi:hypothetical protein